MRALALLGCVVLLVCGCAGQQPFAEPADDDWTARPAAVPMSKIGRGLVNVVTSPAELWATPTWLSDEGETTVYAIGVGVPQGICNGVVRLVAGVAEVVSFPLFKQRMPLYNHAYGIWAFAKEDESLSMLDM